MTVHKPGAFSHAELIALDNHLRGLAHNRWDLQTATLRVHAKLACMDGRPCCDACACSPATKEAT